MTQNFSAHSGRAESRPFPVAERTWPVWLFFARARNSPRAFCPRDRSRGNSCLRREKYHFCIQLQLYFMERSKHKMILLLCLIIEQSLFESQRFLFYFREMEYKKKKKKENTRNSRRMFLILGYYWNIRRKMVFIENLSEKFYRVIREIAYHRIDFCNSSWLVTFSHSVCSSFHHFTNRRI